MLLPANQFALRWATFTGARARSLNGMGMIPRQSMLTVNRTRMTAK
jgi:hypothetical protein